MTIMQTEIEPVITDEVEFRTDDADPNHRTHIVSPPENKAIFGYLMRNGNPSPSAKEIVDTARKYKLVVVALCGYRFIPERNPDTYDACQACFKVAEIYMSRAGE